MASDLMDILKSLVTPYQGGGPVVQSDAPGTNERDVQREGQDNVMRQSVSPVTPDAWRRERHPGPGPSGVLGYADRGDPVRIAQRMHELSGRTRQRFPDLATHGRPGPHAPEFNILYDVFKSNEAYDKVILATAHNTWVVGTTLAPQTVTLDVPLPITALFNQFPGGIQVYPVLLMFSFGQSVTTATGEYSIAFIPQGGDFQYPLGEYSAGQPSINNYMRHIIRAAITDPGQQVMGQINITTNAVVGTPSIFWRMGFGFAAFIPAPAFKTSKPLHTLDWIDAAPEPALQLAPNMAQGGDAGRRG